MADETISSLLRSRLAAIRNDPSIPSAEKRKLVQEELAMAQDAINGLNAQDVENAGKLGIGAKAATFLERGVNSASFGLGGLAGDAIAALEGDKPYRESFKDVRAARADRNNQLGAWGYAADLVGAAVPGVSAFKTLSAIPRIAKMGAVKVAAAEAAGQGALTGASEGLNELSTEGVKNAGTNAAIGAGLGATLGGTLGFAAGKVREWHKGGQLAKDLVARGVKLDEAQAIASQLPTLDFEKANAALSRVDEMVKQGRGDLVMAADVLGGEGHNALRASANVSGDADALARERLRTRDTGIVARGRKDLGEAAGFTPEQMDAHENALLAARKQKADASYLQARDEGRAFDAIPSKVNSELAAMNERAGRLALPAPGQTADALAMSRLHATAPFEPPTPLSRAERRRMAKSSGEPMEMGNRQDITTPMGRIRETTPMPDPQIDPAAFERPVKLRAANDVSVRRNPEVPAPVEPSPNLYDDATKAVDSAANDPMVADEFAALAHDNPQGFTNADPKAFDVQLELYQRINKQIRDLSNKPMDASNRQARNGLMTAKAKLGRALELRSQTFRPANADYAEFSKGLENYQLGQDAASQSLPSEARRIAAKADPSQGQELNKGFVDRMAEYLGKGPNEDLGPAASVDNSTRKAMVGSENAAQKIKDRLGDPAYQKLLGNAKAEGRMAATTNALTGNSTTAKQVTGLNDLLGVASEVGSSISANPIWFATQFARRVAGDAAKQAGKKQAVGAAKKIADAMTRGGEKEAKSVIEDLLAEMNRKEAAKLAGQKVARVTRNAVARAAAPNQ